MNNNLKEVTIYTDGACSGNPGPGGYGVVLMSGPHRQELSGGYQLTTNNRMELMAAIIGLEALKFPCAVNLYTDSRYIVDAINKGWAKKWQKNNWKRSQKESAKNPDLWERLLKISEQHQVQFLWVKGHSGDEENECCDRLAVKACQQPDLLPDLGYSQEN
ncbi:MAG TPA: ribonuclease HI [Oscillatoriales bacterium UBA8482]|nr:MAG: ribonuclease HI [Oscillatoriales cyanobacterium CG2_30_40_61]HBW58486.1 ribonuclease HI [Oscillatoriales bacterium UBA8482]